VHQHIGLLPKHCRIFALCYLCAGQDYSTVQYVCTLQYLFTVQYIRAPLPSQEWCTVVGKKVLAVQPQEQGFKSPQALHSLLRQYSLKRLCVQFQAVECPLRLHSLRWQQEGWVLVLAQGAPVTLEIADTGQ